MQSTNAATRKTRQRFHTLEILASEGVTHGFAIASAANLQVGTVYGILMAFEKDGYVESTWEEETPKGRPRRRLYRLTESGFELLRAYAAHFGADASLGVLARASRDLSEAIDQVWGGMWRKGAKPELTRQSDALAAFDASHERLQSLLHDDPGPAAA